MKNIHILPTDKPSRLHNTFNILRLEKGFELSPCNQNIYITSDEEIKEGDWFIDDKYKQPIKYFGEGSLLISSKKIIITTDQDLISVQAIDDEFLEWLVKNPSCEEVEITYHRKGVEGIFKNVKSIRYYGLIIPKEKPKQDKIMERFIANAKQETLEEVAERRFGKGSSIGKKYFIEGAKWQQEQIGKSEFLQKLRGTLSDAEARRIIRTI